MEASLRRVEVEECMERSSRLACAGLAGSEFFDLEAGRLVWVEVRQVGRWSVSCLYALALLDGYLVIPAFVTFEHKRL